MSPFSMSFPNIILNIGENKDIGNLEGLSNFQSTAVLSSPIPVIWNFDLLIFMFIL